jgi:hypothetical protein
MSVSSRVEAKIRDAFSLKRFPALVEGRLLSDNERHKNKCLEDAVVEAVLSSPESMEEIDSASVHEVATMLANQLSSTHLTIQ